MILDKRSLNWAKCHGRKPVDIYLKKPDPRAFHRALKMLDSQPSETVFIDDNPKNVEMAKSDTVGMHAILFTDVEQLWRGLRLLGVNPM